MNGFFDYLDEVRARPEAARRRLLWWLTAAGALLVVGLWLVQWQATLRAAKTLPTVTAENRAAASFITEIPWRIKLGWQKIFQK